METTQSIAQDVVSATSALASSAAGAISGNSGTMNRIQVINEAKEFTPELTGSLDKWGLLDAGFGYNLCAVIGSQSTGKSTLLNKLFGTSFEVMDESQRRQTTKGIWMCRGKDMKVLVMDVEGSDGRERGEDQDFERKSALFSMSSAEVLIVNMWEHQVGLYQGANMGLLKTVFEVNLSLFQASKSKQVGPKDKTLLLFIIRDHVGHTPLTNLQATIMADLTRLWDGLSKPEGLEASSITDFFDFNFTTLPHKILMPDEFERQVVQLRSRFDEPQDPNFVFKTQYHKRIPADGLPHYLNSIWDQVMSNKDLDLPTQQELLAQFRCDEIANAAFAIFSNEVKVFRRPIEVGSVLATLGPDMNTHRSTALSKFDRDASRYHQEVYKRKRIDLLEKLNSTLSPFFLGQLKNLHKAILAEFKTNVVEKLRGEGNDFAEVVTAERSKAELAFNTASTAILLSDTDWDTAVEEERTQLDSDITQIADQCRAEETKKMITQIERTFKKAIAEPTELALSKPKADMWDNVLKVFKESLATAEATYSRRAKSFNCTEEENTEALRSLRRKAWLALRAKIDEQTADLPMIAKLRNVFEERFRYDADGVPRVWKPDDDIDGVFRKARDQTLSLVPIYAKIAPSNAENEVSLPSSSDDPASAAAVDRGEEEDFDFPASLTVFTETRKEELGSRFRKEADAYFVEAKRSTVSSIAQVPLWMYGVMVMLGWNEFMAVVRNPLYFTFLLLVAAGAFVVYKLNLSGPLVSVSKAVMREMHRLADEQLRAHFSQPLPQPAMLRDGSSSSRAGRSAAEPEEIELKPTGPSKKLD
ncbi:Dynamin-like GTPase that mediates homotypic ER fusion [Tilletia horrida]|nr:Dynamin-like GTPase that mediates homotypic ER fusion [Tilletia horrida]